MGTTFKDCSQHRSHTGAAAVGSLEEHTLRNKDQRVKTVMHTTAPLLPHRTDWEGLSVTCSENREFNLRRYLSEDESGEGARKELP